MYIYKKKKKGTQKKPCMKKSTQTIKINEET